MAGDTSGGVARRAPPPQRPRLLLAAALLAGFAILGAGAFVALEARGIATEPWFERQLALALLGALVQFGWEKALGGYDEELAWWENKAVTAAALLS